MGNILNIVFVIIGALIGAGFASGQEIYSFFYKYGVNGILGLLLTSIFLGIIIFNVLNIIKERDIKTYKEFLESFQERKIKRKYLNLEYITNIIINIFLLITFYIMIAGFGAYFSQEMGINNFIGSLILAIICFIIFLGNVNSLLKANEILVPLLIFFIIIIGGKNLIGLDFSKYIYLENYNIKHEWIFSSIIYFSYNTILLIPVLITLKNQIKSKKSIALISFLSGLITFILAIAIFFLLEKVDININTLEMPAVYVISKFFRKIKTLYGFIILTSILTTSISIGMSFLNNVVKNKKNYPQIAAIMCITSLFFYKFKFSKLVSMLYPIFGWLGLIQIFYIFMLKKR